MTAEDIRLLAEADEVNLETRSGPRTHRVIIWVVEVDGSLYIRSWLGESAKWFRRVSENPGVALTAGRVRVEFTAVPATDDASNEAVSEAFWNKYPNDKETASMVRDEILHTTLRLDPVR